MVRLHVKHLGEIDVDETVTTLFNKMSTPLKEWIVCHRTYTDFSESSCETYKINKTFYILKSNIIAIETKENE